MTNKYIDWIEKQAKTRLGDKKFLDDNKIGSLAGGIPAAFVGIGHGENLARKLTSKLGTGKISKGVRFVTQVGGTVTGAVAGAHVGTHLGAGAQEGLRKAFTSTKSKN